MMMLKDRFVDAISPRTLSNWISDFNLLDKDAISRDAPFELHLIEDYGLPLEASEYISEMLFELRTNPQLPMFPSNPHYEGRNGVWEPTVREIDWWWRVHNMADDLSYQDIYLIASHYYVRDLLEDIGQIPATYSDLDGFMTYKPWRSEERTAWYTEEVRYGEKFGSLFHYDEDFDYPTRGLFDEAGAWNIGENMRVIWEWAQMEDRKYLTPHKALIMTMIAREGMPVQYKARPRAKDYVNFRVEEREGVEQLIAEITTRGARTEEVLVTIKEAAEQRGLSLPDDIEEVVEIEVIDIDEAMNDQPELTIDTYKEILWPVFNKEEHEEIKEHINQKGELDYQNGTWGTPNNLLIKEENREKE